jgi:hypothetical protein
MSERFKVTTRERYLTQLEDNARVLTQDRTLNTKPLHNWANRNLTKLAEQGRLVSERQYQDHRQRRVLRVGDRVQYVGPDRVEDTTDGSYTRPQGQQGTISKTERRGAETLVTFRPDAAAPVQRVVELVVLTNTPGYFTLERLPARNPAAAGTSPARNPGIADPIPGTSRPITSSTIPRS